MTVQRRSRIIGAAAVAALALLQLTPLHAQAGVDPNGVGAGAVVITITSSQGYLNCTVPADVSGTGVATVTINGKVYSGLVTIAGSITCPTDIQARNVSLVVSGSDATGYLQCGTPASPMTGFFIPVGTALFDVLGACEVDGETSPLMVFNAEGPIVPTSVDPSTVKEVGWTVVAPAQWANYP